VHHCCNLGAVFTVHDLRVAQCLRVEVEGSFVGHPHVQGGIHCPKDVPHGLICTAHNTTQARSRSSKASLHLSGPCLTSGRNMIMPHYLNCGGGLPRSDTVGNFSVNFKRVMRKRGDGHPHVQHPSVCWLSQAFCGTSAPRVR